MSQCALCRDISSKSILYVCDSGRILCGNCHANGTPGLSCARLGDGDYSNHKRKKSHKEKKPIKLKPCKDDLARGDFNKTEIVNQNENCRRQDVNNTDDIIITYKNDLYRENPSDTSIGSINEKKILEKDNAVMQKHQSLHRPLACPVCSKIVAMDSILQHFFFDHSKVPRHILKLKATQEILLKVSDLERTINCLSVILLEDCKSMYNSPLLVMVARLTDIPFQDTRNMIGSTSLCQISKTSESIIDSKNKKHSKTSDDINDKLAELNYDLILWICKTVTAEIICDIKLTREDKKMSFSYTGDATHIRDTKNGLNMYQKSECLIIRRTAVKKLINHRGNVLVSVTVLQVDS